MSKKIIELEFNGKPVVQQPFNLIAKYSGAVFFILLCTKTILVVVYEYPIQFDMFDIVLLGFIWACYCWLYD